MWLQGLGSRPVYSVGSGSSSLNVPIWIVKSDSASCQSLPTLQIRRWVVLFTLLWKSMLNPGGWQGWRWRWQDDSCGLRDECFHSGKPDMPMGRCQHYLCPPCLKSIHPLQDQPAQVSICKNAQCDLFQSWMRPYQRCKRKSSEMAKWGERRLQPDRTGLTLHILVMPQSEIWVCAVTFIFPKLSFWWNIYVYHLETKNQTSQPNLHGPSGIY